MANESDNRQLRKLQAENKRLLTENTELHKQLNGQASPKPYGGGKRRPFRTVGVILLISLATALLIAGNLLFWAGNTVVKTDRYVESTAPLIRNPAIQDALASKITQQLFTSVNIDQVTQEVLPPRAAFLAPTIAEQVKQHTNETVKKILQRPQFQERWNTAQAHAHDRFITLVSKHGSDGSIDISEVYSDVSQQLQDTKLAFLADKPLPAKVGKVQILSGGWLSALQRTIQHIDTWRTVALILLIVCSVAGVWLSRNRRKIVMVLASFFALGMFITAVSIRLVREITASKADPQYAEAARQTYIIILHPLVVQTFTILFAALLVLLIAWISGPSSSSRAVRQKIDQLFSGKIHGALFSHDNGLTLWLGRYKKILQWLVVGLVACVTLFIRLTPAALLTQFVIIVLLVLLIEILAAKPNGERRAPIVGSGSKRP